MYVGGVPSHTHGGGGDSLESQPQKHSTFSTVFSRGKTLTSVPPHMARESSANSLSLLARACACWHLRALDVCMVGSIAIACCCCGTGLERRTASRLGAARQANMREMPSTKRFSLGAPVCTPFAGAARHDAGGRVGALYLRGNARLLACPRLKRPRHEPSRDQRRAVGARFSVPEENWPVSSISMAMIAMAMIACAKAYTAHEFPKSSR